MLYPSELRGRLCHEQLSTSLRPFDLRSRASVGVFLAWLFAGSEADAEFGAHQASGRQRGAGVVDVVFTATIARLTLSVRSRANSWQCMNRTPSKGLWPRSRGTGTAVAFGLRPLLRWRWRCEARSSFFFKA